MRGREGKLIKVGLFITLGSLLFILGLYYSGNIRYLVGGKVQLTAEFKNASGLMPGNNVNFGGITVGTVERIEIASDTTIIVHFVLDNGIKKYIHQDAVAFIGSEGLMGNRILNLKPGSDHSPLIKNHHKIKTIEPFEKDQLIETLQGASRNVTGITNNINSIVEDVKNGNGVLKMVTTDSLLSQTILATITNLHQSTLEMNKLIRRISTSGSDLNYITKTAKDSIMQSLVHTSQNANKITGQLSNVLGKIDNSNSTISRLLNDTTLSIDIGQTVRNIKQSSADFTDVMKATKQSFLFRRYFKEKRELLVKNQQQELSPITNEQADLNPERSSRD